LEDNRLSQFRKPRRRTAKPLFEVSLNLAVKGSGTSSQTLYRELKTAIVDGRLRAGTRLPSVRQAREYYKVSRNSAAQVYERLTHDGLVAARQGSGTYVAQQVLKSSRAVETADVPMPAHRLNSFWTDESVTAAIGFWRDSVRPSTKTRRTRPVDFRPALVDPRLFPFDVYRKVSAKQLRALQRTPASFRSPQGNQGNFYLREAITKHIALTRAVACGPEEILVTAGAQQAFDLLARSLVTRTETVVAMEDPGYPPMRVAFAAAGARIVPVGVDDEGLIIEDLPRDVGVVCVCPSHQFPLGMTMSARRRERLIQTARARGAVIIEDDYDGEFRFDASPIEALRTGANSDCVFYVGTFSKCMLPAFRLGFVVAPTWAMATLIAAKNCVDWHCSTPIQTAVSEFISGGHLARHVRRMRGIYQERRRLILDFLHTELSEWLDPISSCYGMHVSAVARRSVDVERVADALGRQEIKLHSLSRYFQGPQTRTGLVLGYGAADLPELKRGLVALRKVLSDA
jgi:GntR family transcriptional regulator / MocR family aminotransferase